jgi:RNA 3'-terminal phosphate cyclase (ATP)
MIHIDGAEKSGSGTILRYAISLASVLKKQVHITNIREKREKPGLRPQHLAFVRACAQVCDAEVTGAAVRSLEITYIPRGTIKGGHYEWKIGTAGSTTLLTAALVPVALFADTETVIRISGGLFQDFAPSAHHMQHVLLPCLRRMGVEAELEIIRPGYVPRGGGIIKVRTKPMGEPLRPLALLDQGTVKQINGIAISSHLGKQHVSERMAKECVKVLASAGFQARIREQNDATALQPGASLTVWAETDTGCLIGSDQAGKPGRSAESIGRHVASNLIEDFKSGATVDTHLADELIIYAALAEGTTRYVIPQITDHVEANLWLIEKWGARTTLDGNKLSIDGFGYTR